MTKHGGSLPIIMKRGNTIKPDFLIIGGQKCGTTWLWKMLGMHPETDLPSEKEPHFFSKSINYNKGMEYYYNYFRTIDSSKTTGEASTSYLYDNVRLNIHLEFKDVKIDRSLPSIPELINKELPKTKIFILLRDPVRRAISAYYHHIGANVVSPFTGLQNAVKQFPNRLIIELGQYSKHIKLWQQFVPPERMRIFILEEDIKRTPDKTLENAYSFLNIEKQFKPVKYANRVNTRKRWSNYFLNRWPYKKLNRVIKDFGLLELTDKIAFKILPPISSKDVDFLRAIYLPEKKELEQVIGRNIDCWNYDYTHQF